MFFPGPISNNRQDFGGGACPFFAGELLGKRWPSVSFGLGHNARDVAFLGIVRFTAVPGAGRAAEVGVLGKEPPTRAKRIPSGGGSCTMKSRRKVSPSQPAPGFLLFFISALAVLCYWSSACGSSHGILCPLLLGKLRTFNSEL